MNQDASNDSDKNTTTAPADGDVTAIQNQIEGDRAALGATVDELSDRLDMRKQAKAKAREVQQRAGTTWRERKPAVLGTAAGAAMIGVLLALAAGVRRRRRNNTPWWRSKLR